MPTPNEILERFSRVLNCVCSIQTGGNPLGTGFLVGPDTVLTNYHVVEKTMDAEGQFKVKVVCIFDYSKLPDGSIELGTPFEVVQCLECSRYGDAEVGDKINDPMPTVDQLDYALLRLAQHVGEMPMKGGRGQRGWIDLWDTPWDAQPGPAAGVPFLASGSRIIVIQHPLGAPQVYAARNFTGENALHTRMRYQYMTERGSSGSPCLNDEYKLVALHHLGDASWNSRVEVSQGVPIKLIRERIVKNNPTSIPKFNVLLDARQAAPWAGLFSVLDLYPKAKEAIRKSRETIKFITGRIAELRGYKIIHDVLTTIHDNLAALDAALNEQDRKKSRDAIQMTGTTMLTSWFLHQKEIAEINNTRKASGLPELKWIDELERAMTSLSEQKSDQISADFDAAQIIHKHVRFKSPELNAEIRRILNSLPVDQLLAVFGDIDRTIELGAIREAVNAGPKILRELWDRLRENVNDHDLWQDIENDMSMLEECLPLKEQLDRYKFKATWEHAWSNTRLLCQAYPEELWSRATQGFASRISDDINSGNWSEIGKSFENFRTVTSARFSYVDKSLLLGAEQIIQLGNPLSALVEASI